MRFPAVGSRVAGQRCARLHTQAARARAAPMRAARGRPARHGPVAVRAAGADGGGWSAVACDVVDPPFIGEQHGHLDIELPYLEAGAGADAEVAVIGSGPAGLGVAWKCAEQGMRVVIVDPDPLVDFVPTYGVWVDEFKQMGLDDVFEKVWDKAMVTLTRDGADKRYLDRPYARVDKRKFKTRLVEECKAAGVRWHKAFVDDDLKHADGCTTIPCSDGTALRAAFVVDATGHARRFVEMDGEFDPGYQGAYGILAEVESHPFEQDKMLFMDWSDDHCAGDMKARNDRLPTFLYMMPLSPTTIFLEETSLVARPAVPFEDLKERLYARLDSYGVKVKGVYEEELCLIPMGGVLPKLNQRVIGVGGTGGHVHPSTGYMVSRTLGAAPAIADAIANQLLDRSPDAGPGAATSWRWPATEDAANEAARRVWQSSWPVERIRQRAFFNFGMDVLLTLDIRQTRQFFDAFFALKFFHWAGFLSSRLSFFELIVFGLNLFANSCQENRINLIKQGVPGLVKMLYGLAGTLQSEVETRRDRITAFDEELVASRGRSPRRGAPGSA
ncbi:unnamed protein product [Pedinophyceae sp. YPF-701]|nr:unnamed protein product [Pedinophyceae sp. YPF-701]